MFWAVSPVGAVLPIKLLSGARVNFGGAPVLLAGVQGAVLKPNTIAEERNLAGVVRILGDRKILEKNMVLIRYNKGDI